MTYRPIHTGDQRVDSALNDIARVINRHGDDIAKNRNGIAEHKELTNKNFSIMHTTIETETLLVGDVAGGNYTEIKSNGEIELHGTNLLQINNGVIYLKNGATTIRLRVESGTFYVENETSPSVWDELFSAT